MREFKVGDKIKLKRSSYHFDALSEGYGNRIAIVELTEFASYPTIRGLDGWWWGILYQRDWEFISPAIKRNIVTVGLP